MIRTHFDRLVHCVLRPSLFGFCCLTVVAMCGTTFAVDPFSQPGEYAVGTRTVSVQRSDGSTFDMLLYHPADTAGVDVTIATGTNAFPAVTFGPGFLQTNSQYESTLSHLASWGYLVGSTESQLSFAPDKPQYAQDLSDMLTYLEASNSNANSDLVGRVATDRFGVSGHSLGGGVSVLTAVADSRVKAVANFAAASTNAPPPFPPNAPPTDDPSAIALAADLNIPVSFISGSQDSIIPVSENGQLMYNHAASPKLLPNIIGGYHCGFVDTELPVFCDVGSVPAAEQQALARAELTSFFETYLGENDDAWKRVWGPDRENLFGVATQLEPGILLAAGDPLMAISPGEDMAIEFTLTNLSAREQSFDLFAESDLLTSSLSTSTSPLLAPNESFVFQLAATAPGGPLLYTEEILVSARSGFDGGTRAYQLIPISVVPEPSNFLMVCLAIGLPFWMRRRSRSRLIGQ